MSGRGIDEIRPLAPTLGGLPPLLPLPVAELNGVYCRRLHISPPRTVPVSPYAMPRSVTHHTLRGGALSDRRRRMAAAAPALPAGCRPFEPGTANTPGPALRRGTAAGTPLFPCRAKRKRRTLARTCEGAAAVRVRGRSRPRKPRTWRPEDRRSPRRARCGPPWSALACVRPRAPLGARLGRRTRP